MCGCDRTTIISTKLYWPNGLSIDYPNKRLYFADARLDFIEFCDYDGRNRHQVIASDHVSNFANFYFRIPYFFGFKRKFFTFQNNPKKPTSTL